MKTPTPPDHTDLSELREELKAAHNRFHGRFDTHGEVAVHAQWTPQELENVQIKDEELFYDEISALFKQYAQPPVVADEELDRILWHPGLGQEKLYREMRAEILAWHQAEVDRLVAEAEVETAETIRQEIEHTTECNCCANGGGEHDFYAHL